MLYVYLDLIADLALSFRVLAPPGGKSNNIFGFADETPAPAQPQRRAPSQSPFAQDAAPKPQDTGPAKPFRPNSKYYFISFHLFISL